METKADEMFVSFVTAAWGRADQSVTNLVDYKLVSYCVCHQPLACVCFVVVKTISISTLPISTLRV